MPNQPQAQQRRVTPDRSQPSQDFYQALYSYVPQNDDELELRDGDIVDVMEKCDDGWFVGTSRRTRQFGTFPGNYVQDGCWATMVKAPSDLGGIPVLPMEGFKGRSECCLSRPLSPSSTTPQARES
ncbi:hypothetical protein U0070_024070 [Myodes glareolus]|uniref:SH3 domain-containing protein n=1 Tax=Myodes glareolus TaxID=447135 RepID=A0AAW0HUL9_MYOGA